jgi:hypothetical protein
MRNFRYMLLRNEEELGARESQSDSRTCEAPMNFAKYLENFAQE